LKLHGVELAPLGNLSSACPSCGYALVRRPRAKARCPACCDPIFVLTRPWDGQKVLASADDAAALRLQADLFWRFLHSVEGAVQAYPELAPLASDLRSGRRGAAEVDWPMLARIAKDQLQRIARDVPPQVLRDVEATWRDNGWPV
jgi:hypothetical protein